MRNAMTPFRLASLLSIALPLAFHSEAIAQNAAAQGDKGGVGAVAGSQGSAPPDDLSQQAQSDIDEIPEADILVIARYGEAEVESETEFEEAEIATQGADSIDDLLARLLPFIDETGEAPVILVNGKPIGFDRSILSYPPEALTRLALLKPEAAARYGEPPGKRVVNLVLKQSFASLTADVAANVATAGGQQGGTLSVTRVAIDGPTRWNARARTDRQSALLRSARDLPPRDVASGGTGFVANPDGGEIDAALSLLAGEIVTVAAIPPDLASRAPTLADFAAGGIPSRAVDPDDFETLLPSRRTLSFGAGLTHPVGAFSGSLSIDASSSDSDGQRGLPMSTVVLASDSAWSPFANEVALSRPFSLERGLRSESSTKALGATATLSGRIGDWQSNVAASYARNWTDNLLESGLDQAGFQQRIDSDPAFNPYGPLDDHLLRATRNRSQGETIAARANISKVIVDLPAGPLTSNYSLNFIRNRSENRRSDALAGAALTDERSGAQTNGRVSFGIPLSRREEGEVRPLGDLSLDLSLGGQTGSGSGFRTQLGGGFAWSPLSILQFRGSLEVQETAPNFDQLNGPLVTDVSRVFDFAQQETVDIVQISGGNPDLERGRRQSLSLTATLRPFNDQMLALSVNYRNQTAQGGVIAFPTLTPAIEAAFPERITRDAGGRLIAVDTRPITFDWEKSAELNSGIALRLPRRSAVAVRGQVRDPLQVTLSLNHRWRLKSELSTRPGLPVIDSLSADGGQSRHFLSAQSTVGTRGVGASVNASWSNPARIRGGDPADGSKDFRIVPPLTLNLSFFVEPIPVGLVPVRYNWFDNVRLSIEIANLFDDYRRVLLADATIPAGFMRDEIDPIGRVISLSVRKRF